jgi:leucine dehydrogenase
MILDAEFEHERLEMFHDRDTGLTGAVAIHSTALGPAMGGLRLRAYAGITSAAADALRLARAMTYKNAAAGLELGGGKAVLIDDGRWNRRGPRMRAFGSVVERLGGRYVTAEDVGTTPADMVAIAATTKWVAGQPVDRGGRGDPGGATARTVFGAIAAAVSLHMNVEGLAGVRVGVLGVGSVGSRLVRMLRQAGATVILTDIDWSRARRVAQVTNSSVAPLDGFLTEDFDVLAPCAVGEAIRTEDIGSLRCRILAGGANNPLADEASAAQLAEAGILYVPDFLANCGGIIHVGAEVLGFDDLEVERRIEDAINRTADVLHEAHNTNRPPLEIALRNVKERLAGTRTGAPA